MVNYWSIFSLPGYCLLCRQRCAGGEALCPGCRHDLLANTQACPVCASPLHTTTSQPCGQCQRTPPPYQQSHIPYLYASTLKPLISAFKFQQDLVAGRVLADLFIQALPPRDGPLPECLLPVPLHARRVAERGFNQAVELAKIFARRLALPCNTRLLQRIRHTAPQTNLSAEQRHRNLRNAFALRSTATYQHVAIVDDVVTTGSTVIEIARLLRQAGIEQIEVWALARAYR